MALDAAKGLMGVWIRDTENNQQARCAGLWRHISKGAAMQAVIAGSRASIGSNRYNNII